MNQNAYNTKHTVKKYCQKVSDRRQDEHKLSRFKCHIFSILYYFARL